MSATSVIAVVVVCFVVIALPVMVLWKGKVTGPTMGVIGFVGLCGAFIIALTGNFGMIGRLQMTPKSIDFVRRSTETVAAKADEVKAMQKRVESLAKQVAVANRQVEASKTRIAELVREAGETRAQVADAGTRAAAAAEKVGRVEKQTVGLLAQAERTRGQVATAGKRAMAAATEVKAVEGRVSAMQANMQQTWRSLLTSYVLAIGTKNLFPAPANVGSEIDKHLSILAEFAYPDRRERDREVRRLMGTLADAQKAMQQGE